MPMAITFSSHASKRLLERNLSRQMVSDTLSSPDKRLVKEGLDYAVKQYGNKALIVVFRKTGEEYFIITVILTSKIKKFL